MQYTVNYNLYGGLNNYDFLNKKTSRDEFYPPGFRISGSSRRIYQIFKNNNLLDLGSELLNLHSNILVAEIYKMKIDIINIETKLINEQNKFKTLMSITDYSSLMEMNKSFINTHLNNLVININNGKIIS